MTHKAKTSFRIVGGDGEWFAYCDFTRLPIWAPHARKILVRRRKGLFDVIAIAGRTPFEALERLKRYLGVAE